MSLYEEADGLLETHVTWHDVEEEIQKAFDTKATFGENKKATNISDWKGFFSRIALIDPDWQNVEDDKKGALPHKFVVKMPSQLALVTIGKIMKAENLFNAERLSKMGETTRLMHNREVLVYRMLEEQNNPDIPITKIFASRLFDESNQLKAYLISEYVENVHHIGMHESIPYQDLIPVIKSVAAFSAIGQKIEAHRVEFIRNGPNVLDLAFNNFLDEKMMAVAISTLKNAFSEEYQEKVDRFAKENREFYMRLATLQKYKTVHKFFGYEPVLIHSDLWASNLLYTKNNGNLELKSIIDWQTTIITSPGQELARFFISTLSKKDRREHASELMELYYNTFVENLDGRPAPYTLQNLIDSYNLYAPLMTMMVLPGIEPVLKQFTTPEMQQVRDEAMDKMIGLLEDFVSRHDQNLIDYPGFYKD